MQNATISPTDFGATWRCAAVPLIDGPHGWIAAQAILWSAGVAALLAVQIVGSHPARKGGTLVLPGAACTWVLDCIKLMAGQVVLGCLNLVATALLRQRSVESGHASYDLCGWYLVGVLANTFVGAPLTYCGLRAVELAGGTLEERCDVEYLASWGGAVSRSGRYGVPPGCVTWILQILAWCAVVVVANAVPLLLLAVGAPLRLAVKLVGNITAHDDQGPDTVDAVTLSFVVLLLTVAPLWMQYSFVKYQPPTLRTRRRSAQSASDGHGRMRLSSSEIAAEAAVSAGGEVNFICKNEDFSLVLKNDEFLMKIGDL